MDKKSIAEAVKKAKENAKKRKFTQKIDLVVTLKDLNLKKTEEQVDEFQTLQFSAGKTMKICAIVGPELHDQAKEVFDHVILAEDLEKFKDKKTEIKKLADGYDYFVAQGNLMGKLASVFGRVFGPRGKMPNPKAGCVVPPKGNLRPVYERLSKTIRLSAKTVPMVQVMVGNESMPDEEVASNAFQTLNNIIHHLPKEKHNIKAVYLKLTMGKPVQVQI